MRYLHNLSLEKTIFFLLILLSFFLSVNSLIQATKWVNRPFPGFLVYNSLIVSQVTLPRWSLSRELGIRSYDKILKVDGHPVSSAYELYDFVDDTPVGTLKSYLVLRDGKLYELSIPTMKFTFDDLLQIFGIEFTIGLIFLISGVVVYVLKPQLTVSKIFLLMCISIGVWFIEDFNYQTTYSPFYSLNIAYLAQIFTPAFLINLSLVFPSKKPIFRMKPYVFWISLFLSGVIFALQLVYVDSPSIWKRIDTIVWVYLLLGGISIPLSAVIGYFHPSGVLEKQRAQTILLGSFLGFFIPALLAFLIVVFEFNSITYVALPVIFFPLSIAYAIVKHKLFDIDVIIQKSILYSVLTSIVVAFFALTVLVFNMLFAEHGGWENPFFFLILSVFLVVALNPIKGWIQGFIDTAFFRKNYDYTKTLSEISSAMTSLLNLDEIASKIISTVTDTMQIASASLFILDQNTGDYRIYMTTLDELRDKGFFIKSDDKLVSLFYRYKQEIFKEDLVSDNKYMKSRIELTRMFNQLKASLMIPLFFRAQLVGILVLGEKKSGLMYSSRDIKLLRTLANQSAIAIENAFAFKLVEDYAKRLEETNRKLQETQTQLIQAEKMSAIGQLAAGIAHEIRNPLNIIEGARYYLYQMVEGEKASIMREYLEYIKHEIDRTNRLIDSLLKFSKMEPPHFEPVNINSILENALVLLRKQLQDNRIVLKTEFDPNIPQIMGDPNQLWQVFINILLNAIQAMPLGGELKVVTGICNGDQNHVFASFTDSGIGIDEEDLPRIFDPFFTKKDKGTGLGLSVSYKIVEGHKGKIVVSSEKGKSTTFVVELPVNQQDNARGVKGYGRA